MPAALFRLIASSASDGDLLRRFTADRDADAFAELVRRHGPVVYRVCRRLLGSNSADDAFQATFLILATRPGSVRKADSVASWLIGVAGRVARQMRKRDRRASGVSRPSVHTADALSRPEVFSRPAHAGRSQELEWSEQFRILDEELTRLPDRLRGPVVACLLQGRTQEQAARDLGGSVRTIRRRLDEAKRLLRVRLERRGVVPAVAAGLAAGLGEAAATLPPHLPAKTTETVFDFLAGGAATTAPPALIARGVMMGTLIGKVKVLMVTAALGLTALGVGVAGDGGGQPAPGDMKRPRAARPSTVPPPQFGGVLDFPQGKAVDTGVKCRLAPTDEFGTVWLRMDRIAVIGPTPAAVRAIAHEAAFQWKEQSELWLGKIPAKTNLTIGWKSDGSSSSYSFTTTGTGVGSAVIRLHGPLQPSLEDQLPREITHLILAQHLGPRVPLWAVWGAGAMATSRGAKAELDRQCRARLGEGRSLRLAALFDQFNKYPQDWEPLAAESFSVTRFLLSRPTESKTRPPANANRQRFLQFVQSGAKNGWDQAAKTIYGFETVGMLEAEWIGWLKRPASRLAPDQPRAVKPAPKPAESERIPPVKLSAPEQPDRIGQIIIVGNKLTADQVILDKLGLTPGRILQYPKLQAAKENLERLGLFTDVDVHVVPSDLGSPHVNIEVRVREKQPNGNR